MARIFITGSADGSNFIHQPVTRGGLARPQYSAQQVLNKVPGAEKVLIADVSRVEETKKLAKPLTHYWALDIQNSNFQY